MERQMRSPDGPSRTLPPLLDGLNITTNDRPLESSLWSSEANFSQPSHTPSTSRSNVVANSITSPNRSISRSQTSTPRRMASGNHENSTPEPDAGSSSSQFDPPSLRSIFATGQPTSSISANTAQASMSTASPSTISGPFAALANASGSRRRDIRPTEIANVSGIMPQNTDYAILGTEKDIDDPNSQLGGPSEGLVASTSQAVSNLFNTSGGATPGFLSRETTGIRRMSNMLALSNDTSTLTGHLLNLGFIEGRHSDITIKAFGKQYRLHKLLLDRVPYFSSAFRGPWAESSATEMALLPEEIDANITQTAFELALRRIYGSVIPSQEEQEAIGLFATGCWLDMPDLVESCIDHILRQMQPATLHVLIKLVTNSYYGQAGDRILSSAKAMLCRDGWEMPYEYWDEIPADIIREIIGGDPFYIPSEWERWYLALKLLNRRLRKLAIEMDLVSADGKYLVSQPSRLRSSAIRPGHLSRPRRGVKARTAEDEAWSTLYSHARVAPLLTLLDEGVHYVHLQFEQLQLMRSQRDILGIPVLPDKVISDALWMSMEIRQRVLKAHEGDVELGLSEAIDTEEDDNDDEDISNEEDDVPTTPTARSGSRKGKQRVYSLSSSATSSDLDSPTADPGPRKFWIPSNDVSCIMGGSREAYTATSLASPTDYTPTLQRTSATPDVTDSAWAAALGSSLFDTTFSSGRNFVTRSRPCYSRYPPFRFCAEFPNPRSLKEQKRVYSQTVWYAGSLWNLYISRLIGPKNQQLGIYLHRAKDKNPSDDPLALTVDDRIGQLEREMLMRRGGRRSRYSRADNLGGISLDLQEQEESHGSSNDYDVSSSNHDTTFNTSAASATTPSRSNNKSNTVDATQSRPHKTSQSPHKQATSTNTRSGANNNSRDTLPSSDDADINIPPSSRPRYHYHHQGQPQNSSNQGQNSSTISASTYTIPPYTDSRTTIKTYFKIYSPTRGGRLLSVYESAPDSFHSGKSWGWTVSWSVLDEGFDGVGGMSGGGGAMGTGGKGVTGHSGHNDGRLRYMVVIGNV